MAAAKKDNPTSNLRVWDAVAKTPPEARKPITGGRLKGMTDISPILRLKHLTNVFGPCGLGWYVDDILYEQFTPDGTPEVAVICRLKLYVKDPQTGEWSKGITGVGGSKLFAREKDGLYLNDEAFKMAETDAISVAAKKLGVCADVYWSGEEHTKYMFDAENANSIAADPKPSKFTADTWARDLAQKCSDAGLDVKQVIDELKARGEVPDKFSGDLTTSEWLTLKAAVDKFINTQPAGQKA